MTAYYPLFEDELKEGPPGMPGIGFKLTNDGNYDMEDKILKNCKSPEDDNDSSTKKYVDDFKKKCLIRNNGYFDAKRKLIRNLEDPREESDACNKKYVDELRGKSLIHDEKNFDAKNKAISNVKDPENKSDVVTKKHLDYYCILWDRGNMQYNARNERISHVKWPNNSGDCANKSYVDNKTFCATTDRVVEFTGVGYKTFQFNEFTSRLLDSNLALTQDMFMKITIYLACDKMADKPSIRLEKGPEVLIDRAISVNTEAITWFGYGKVTEVVMLSVLTGGKCKLKPYLHVEKLVFSLKK